MVLAATWILGLWIPNSEDAPSPCSNIAEFCIDPVHIHLFAEVTSDFLTVWHTMILCKWLLYYIFQGMMTSKGPCIFNPDTAKNIFCLWLVESMKAKPMCREVWLHKESEPQRGYTDVTQLSQGMVGWDGGGEGAGIPGWLTNPLPLMRGVWANSTGPTWELVRYTGLPVPQPDLFQIYMVKRSLGSSCTHRVPEVIIPNTLWLLPDWITSPQVTSLFAECWQSQIRGAALLPRDLDPT